MSKFFFSLTVFLFALFGLSFWVWIPFFCVITWDDARVVAIGLLDIFFFALGFTCAGVWWDSIHSKS